MREEIENWRTNQHICDPEGYGCKYEDFQAHGIRHIRCRLLRESDDRLLALITTSNEALLRRVRERLPKRAGLNDPVEPGFSLVEGRPVGWAQEPYYNTGKNAAISLANQALNEEEAEL